MSGEVVQTIEHASEEEFLIGAVKRGARTRKLKDGRLRIISYVGKAAAEARPRKRQRKPTVLDQECLV